MQTLSRTTFPIASLLIVALTCDAAEEHLMVDRTGESVLHYAEAGGPPPGAVATNLPLPWSVMLDANAEMVYWTEIGSGSIFRTPLGGGAVESVYYSSNSVLRGLVVDSATDTLYFLDSETKYLNALDLNTLAITPFLYGFQRPNDMVLDRVNHALFMTDSGLNLVVRYDLGLNTFTFPLSGSNIDGAWGIDVVPESNALYLSDHRTNAIMRANLDGSNLAVLVTGQETPRGLCVDRHHGRLYWLEAESGELRSSTLEGLDVQVVLTNAAVSPRDLASYEFFDQDGDFMNDAQERFYFGHLLEGAYGDADGDGVDSFTELAFGSNPNDAGDAGMGTQFSFLEGFGPMLGYYLRTDEWMNYTVMHTDNLQQPWKPVQFIDELLFIPNGANGATRIIVIDENDNLLGRNHFFRVEADR